MYQFVVGGWPVFQKLSDKIHDKEAAGFTPHLHCRLVQNAMILVQSYHIKTLSAPGLGSTLHECS